MHFKLIILFSIFLSCGVKDAPISDKKVPSVFDKYFKKEEVKKKQKENK